VSRALGYGSALAIMDPMAALADLPALEDLPLEGLGGNSASDTFIDPLERWKLPIFGVDIPVILLGAIPVFVMPPVIAATCAFFWVNNMKPTRGNYKTYFGGGQMPPQGYTNPLEVRLPKETGEAGVARSSSSKANGKSRSSKGAKKTSSGYV